MFSFLNLNIRKKIASPQKIKQRSPHQPQKLRSPLHQNQTAIAPSKPKSRSPLQKIKQRSPSQHPKTSRSPL